MMNSRAVPIAVFSVTCALAVSPVPAPAGDPPALRVLDASRKGHPLLRNGGFEERKGAAVSSWRPWKRGFEVVAGAGRDRSVAVVCDRREEKGEFGTSQTLELRREAALPLVVYGWSRAEDVSGSPDSGYALYVDIIYADGTPLWGQTVNFRCGSHDWERREFVILPEKPVRTLTLHCLFRNHTGRVWFDDVGVEEIRLDGGATLFQGLPVEVPATKPPGAGSRSTRATADGLELELAGERVAALRVATRDLLTRAPSGFLARDVAAATDFLGFDQGRCAPLDLDLKFDTAAAPDHLAIEGMLRDTARTDRAITLVFALPLDAIGWHWGDDIERDRTIESPLEYSDVVGVRCGSTGTMSVYPLGAIWNDRVGLALAIDMGRPAVYRLAYNAGTRHLLIAWDFALVPETERFPSSAAFRFVLYRFNPRWGFRAAFAKLREIFPEYFQVRARSQGIWMPFTDVSTVEGWEDFGFRFHEGNNNVAFDDAKGILSFRYTEPMTWWMRMPREAPRTPAEALRIRARLASGNDRRLRRMARVSESAAMHDPDGAPSLLFRDTPWCDGAVWSLNPNPHLPADPNGATVYWNDTIKASLYGEGARGTLDGEYLDSLEGYVTSELNFRRTHFRHTTVPLTFSRDTARPALFKGLAVYEFLRWIAEDIHGMGKLVFANGVPYRFCFLCPWLDVLGTETNWFAAGQYRPPSPARLALWRTLSGAKPYLILMNTDYEALTPDLVERYFQQSLFYGFYPSMFSHNASENPYWKNPSWYNRDRHLFKKYIPVIRRLAEAGWEPVTHAVSANPALRLQRFGPDAEGAVYLTVFNRSVASQEGTIEVDREALGLAGSHRTRPLRVVELPGGREKSCDGSAFRIELRPGEVRAVVLR